MRLKHEVWLLKLDCDFVGVEGPKFPLFSAACLMKVGFGEVKMQNSATCTIVFL